MEKTYKIQNFPNDEASLKLRTSCSSGTAAKINKVLRQRGSDGSSNFVTKSISPSTYRTSKASVNIPFIHQKKPTSCSGKTGNALSKSQKESLNIDNSKTLARRFQQSNSSGVFKDEIMLQRLTNYSNIRKVNCRPVSHEIPPASLMARPNATANPPIKIKTATSTPYSSRSCLKFESDFNSSSTSISDISTSDETELEQTTVIRKSPLVEKELGPMKRNEPQIKVPNMSNRQPIVNSFRGPSSEPKIQKRSCISTKTSPPQVDRTGNTNKMVPKTIDPRKIRFKIPSKSEQPSKCRSAKPEFETSSNPVESNKVTPRSQHFRTQLLHPGWRSVPWKDYFGWTDAHQALLKKLKDEKTKGESIYYKDAEEHGSARRWWADNEMTEEFLGGPTVTSVAEMLEVMEQKRERGSFCYIPRSSPRRRRGGQVNSYDSDSD